jgi:ribose 5-phosphate isomerase B
MYPFHYDSCLPLAQCKGFPSRPPRRSFPTMPKRPLISEQTVRDAARGGRTSIALPPNALVTALARDTARELGVSFADTVPNSNGDCPDRTPDCGCPEAPARTLAIGCDHAGFEIKAALAERASALGWAVTDVGTNSDGPVDYPDFAYAVARLVATCKVALGVMVDGVGVGSAMVANKVPGVRAACCSVEFAAFNARAHNDANVLTIGSRTVGIEANKRILDTFLSTDFEGGRHAGRVQKIKDVEARFLPRTEAL